MAPQLPASGGSGVVVGSGVVGHVGADWAGPCSSTGA